ncbi:hypothetical protein CVT25_008460 [Psilocybe cyanescens]|uniref:Cytochrome P450 n=1 Tax=Psilocybe cyanescens TaxID=93625 RepID=A0A409X6Q8_PSICY|nr:hypothetical protein CVT25_008460 [Psilocybe cyanescens]
MADYIAMVYTLLAILGLKIFIDFLALAKVQTPYPPGPKPKPLIGNMFDFPVAKPALCYVDWGKKYNSSILYAEALGNRVLIVNNRDDAIEIFEKRARIYSDRPYGEEWRQHRKISQQNFNLKASQKHCPIQLKKVHHLLRALHDTPEDFDTHNKTLSISLTMEMMYGLEIKSIQDPYIAIANEAMKLGTSLLVEHLHDTYNFLEEGRAVPSFFTDFFEKKQTFGASEEEQQATQNIVHAVNGAASDTTISATGSFFYFMAVNPDIRKKAQAEIDRVTGSTIASQCHIS